MNKKITDFFTKKHDDHMDHENEGNSDFKKENLSSSDQIDVISSPKRKQLNFEEFQIYGKTADELKTKIVDCLILHFGLGTHIPRGLYDDYKAPAWFKYITWGRIHHIKKDRIINEKTTSTLTFAMAKTIEEFYKFYGQKDKLVRQTNDIELPNPSTLFFFEEDRNYPLQKVITLLKTKSKRVNFELTCDRCCKKEQNVKFCLFNGKFVNIKLCNDCNHLERM